MAMPVNADVAPPATPSIRVSRVFPWVVFTLTFGLLLSDYMSRQVLSAVFPFLKEEWGLTDTQLGSLTSIVALTVGILAVPLSLVGDRWGRVRSIVVMAVVWSLATLGCALAAGYGHLLAARLFIGVGEAAYGSVGLAVVLAVFSARRRASLTGAFMAAGSFGSVLGVALGGVLAVQFGWRWAFAAMGIFGLVLAGLYLATINERKLAAHRVDDNADTGPALAAGQRRARLTTLFSTPAVVFAYLGGGLQLFITGSLFAWLPSYFNRAYDMAPDRAAKVAALFILIIGAGMVVCGLITDRVGQTRPTGKWTTAIVFATLTLILLGAGFAVQPGGAQMLLLALGCFFAAGTTGPTGAMVARLTHESIRATAFGTLTLFNNVLGLAAGPLVTGALADRLGLETAMRYVPLAAVIAVVLLIAGRQAYPSSIRRLEPATATEARDGDTA
ncbi:MFS family permease [Actinoplanes campanulatus]|uniref:MFS family permease n=1 Tax=Actinoplanes campanulatus TaxID=113559 RepID=A0A7W5AR00_9ACTN|nr:MFS transporter [Actinoplanes campanulatus]MBB3100349.1 MFS family permease [Actinoplanes campanulatus]GGN43729.1 MFS transporter [Actinoplanes campanulatus]GID40849.1 MFS transporter [Actinoplanes campanulatus]